MKLYVDGKLLNLQFQLIMTYKVPKVVGRSILFPPDRMTWVQAVKLRKGKEHLVAAR